VQLGGQKRRSSAHDVITGVVEGAAVGEDELDVGKHRSAGLVRDCLPAVSLTGGQPLPATSTGAVTLGGLAQSNHTSWELAQSTVHSNGRCSLHHQACCGSCTNLMVPRSIGVSTVSK